MLSEARLVRMENGFWKCLGARIHRFVSDWEEWEDRNLKFLACTTQWNLVSFINIGQKNEHFLDHRSVPVGQPGEVR